MEAAKNRVTAALSGTQKWLKGAGQKAAQALGKWLDDHWSPEAQRNSAKLNQLKGDYAQQLIDYNITEAELKPRLQRITDARKAGSVVHMLIKSKQNAFGRLSDVVSKLPASLELEDDLRLYETYLLLWNTTPAFKARPQVRPGMSQNSNKNVARKANAQEQRRIMSAWLNTLNARSNVTNYNKQEIRKIVDWVGLNAANLGNFNLKQPNTVDPQAVYDKLRDIQKKYRLTGTGKEAAKRLQNMFLISDAEVDAFARQLGLRKANRNYALKRLVRTKINETAREMQKQGWTNENLGVKPAQKWSSEPWANRRWAVQFRLNNIHRNLRRHGLPTSNNNRAAQQAAGQPPTEPVMTPAGNNQPPPRSFASAQEWNNWNKFIAEQQGGSSPATAAAAAANASKAGPRVRVTMPRTAKKRTNSRETVEVVGSNDPSNWGAFNGNNLNSAKAGSNSNNNNEPRNNTGLFAIPSAANGAIGNFQVLPPIARPGSMSKGTLTKSELGLMFTHMQKIVEKFQYGQRRVDLPLASLIPPATLRHVRQHLFINIQRLMFGKTDAARKLCKLAVTSDDSAYRMFQRMGRITGREEGTGTLTIQLMSKLNRPAASASTGTLRLNVDERDKNNRLAVYQPQSQHPVPMHVRFLEYTDEASLRATHMLSRQVVCNRFPHFTLLYGAGVVTRRNGKKAIMVFQEATHGTLADWLQGERALHEVACALTQVLLALAAVHARDMQHGNLSPDSIAVLRTRPTSERQWWQYRVGNRDLYVTRLSALLLLDPLAPSVRRRSGPGARHCEVSRAIRMFKGKLTGGQGPLFYNRLIQLARQYRGDAVMFLLNTEVLDTLGRMSSGFVRVFEGRATVSPAPGYTFDVVPRGYKAYIGARGVCGDDNDLFFKLKRALSML